MGVFMVAGNGMSFSEFGQIIEMLDYGSGTVYNSTRLTCACDAHLTVNPIGDDVFFSLQDDGHSTQ